MSSHSTVAVITSTIGRPTLIRTIKSIQNQSVPCKHYVFVDGGGETDFLNQVMQDYPEVAFVYLPVNTGANGVKNSMINAVAPYLVKEDIVCFLDDDNWVDARHVEYFLHAFEQYPQAQYAYHLRYMVNDAGRVLCEDNAESLGFWHVNRVSVAFEMIFETGERHGVCSDVDFHRQGLIDVNCYAIKTDLARRLAYVWTHENGLANDKAITQCLIENQEIGICTGKRTVYYVCDPLKFFEVDTQTIEQGLGRPLTDAERLTMATKAMISANESVKQQNKPMPWLNMTLSSDLM